MGETRTYQLPPGDYQGNIGGEEGVFTVEGTIPAQGWGADVDVDVDDPATQEFIESTIGRVPSEVVPFEAPAPKAAKAPVGDTFDEMTAEQLRGELAARALATNGTKSELIERLRAETGGE